MPMVVTAGFSRRRESLKPKNELHTPLKMVALGHTKTNMVDKRNKRLFCEDGTKTLRRQPKEEETEIGVVTPANSKNQVTHRPADRHTRRPNDELWCKLTNLPVDLDRPVRSQKAVAEKQAHLRDLLVTRDDDGDDHVATGIVVHLGQRDLKNKLVVKACATPKQSRSKTTAEVSSTGKRVAHASVPDTKCAGNVPTMRGCKSYKRS